MVAPIKQKVPSDLSQAAFTNSDEGTYELSPICTMDNEVTETPYTTVPNPILVYYEEIRNLPEFALVYVAIH